MAKRSKPKPPQKTSTTAPPGNFRLWASWGIFILGVLLYANTLGHRYAVDDAIVIYDNEFTTKGLAGIPGLLKYDTFRGFFKVEGKEGLVSGGRYRPFTPVMFAAEVQLFSKKKMGENGQPVKDKDGDQLFDPEGKGEWNAVKFVGHLVNVLLYGLMGVVLFWLLLQMLSPAAQNSDWKKFGPFVALAATLLFVVHPVHTEVVANVKGRDEIMALLGSIGALYCTLRAFHEKKMWLHGLAALLFAVALFSKENAITFVAVVPLAYWFFTRTNLPKALLGTLPYVLVAVIFVAIRASKVGLGVGDELPRELMNNPFLKWTGDRYVDFSTGEWLATVMHSLGLYLKLLVVPHPLSHDYYPRALGVMTFGDWQVILSVLAHVAMGVYALIRLPKKDPVSFGILFYLGTLFLVSNIPFPIGTHLSERFLYMPSVGFALVAAVLLHRVAVASGLKKVILGAGVAVLVIFSVLTFVRNFAWKDNFTLFLTDVEHQPNSAKLQNAAGGELVTQAIKPENETKRTIWLNEAIGHLNEAAKIHPTYKNPYLILGNAYNYLEQWDASIQSYENALKLDPNYTDAKNNLQITYRNAGRFFGEKKGDLNQSLKYLAKAYELKPDDYETVRLLGVAYGIGGQGAKALEFFAKGAELEPNNAGAWYDLGVANVNFGTATGNAEQVQLGNSYIQKAMQMDPEVLKKRQEAN